MECGGKRSATPLWIGNGTAGTAELRISRMARIRNGIGTAKALPRPMALSPQSKGNSRDGRWRKTTKVAKSAKSEISGGASSVLPGLRIGNGTAGTAELRISRMARIRANSRGLQVGRTLRVSRDRAARSPQRATEWHRGTVGIEGLNSPPRSFPGRSPPPGIFSVSLCVPLWFISAVHPFFLRLFSLVPLRVLRQRLFGRFGAVSL